MFKSFYYYWKNKLDRIIPINVQGYFYIFAFIVIILGFYLTNSESDFNQKDFYEIQFSNTIDDIVLESDGYHFKIDTNWYLIKHIIVKSLSIGDSIIKEPNSFDVIIKDSVNIKWNSTVSKNLVFRKEPFIR